MFSYLENKQKERKRTDRLKTNNQTNKYTKEPTPSYLIQQHLKITKTSPTNPKTKRSYSLGIPNII